MERRERVKWKGEKKLNGKEKELKGERVKWKG